MNTILKQIVFLVLLTMTSCVSKDKARTNDLSYDNFSKIQLRNVNMKELSAELGSPSEIIKFDKSFKIVEQSNTVNWLYKANSGNFYFYLKDGRLESKSWSLSSNVKEREVKYLLRKMNASWSVVNEPTTNPHRAPSDCYLEDLSKGYLVKINGHLKKVDELRVWVPNKNDKSIRKKLLKNVGKEFCIADMCSKVTDPNAWKHDHCAWLRKLIK